MANILIVDDEREVGNFLFHLLNRKGNKVTVVYNGEQFYDRLEQMQYHLAMIDVKLPDTNGIEILKKLKREQPACKAIVMTGFSMVQTAVEAIKLGANDYIEKPFDDIDQLEQLIDQLLKSDATFSETEINIIANKLGLIIGQSDVMKHLITMAFKIAKKNINVLLEGETGTGKEVIAKFIHHASTRDDQPFIGVNCGALSETLLESELFGHEKGSFTGAFQQRKGLFEIASKGTLFLDEVAESSPQIQVKLLRILETREFMRIGSEYTLRTNARIIAASHVNLEEAVKLRKFREDLLYRLNVVKLQIPPLRERKDDIRQLVDHFVAHSIERQVEFSNETVDLLLNYDWPGNIRELANVVTRALTLSEGETNIITPQYLPQHISCDFVEEKKIFYNDPKERIQLKKIDHFEEYLHLWTDQLRKQWESEQSDLKTTFELLKELERKVGQAFIKKALRETLGNRKEAAGMLGITERKLRYILNEK